MELPSAAEEEEETMSAGEERRMQEEQENGPGAGSRTTVLGASAADAARTTVGGAASSPASSCRMLANISLASDLEQSGIQAGRGPTTLSRYPDRWHRCCAPAQGTPAKTSDEHACSKASHATTHRRADAANVRRKSILGVAWIVLKEAPCKKGKKSLTKEKDDGN